MRPHFRVAVLLACLLPAALAEGEGCRAAGRDAAQPPPLPPLTSPTLPPSWLHPSGRELHQAVTQTATSIASAGKNWGSVAAAGIDQLELTKRVSDSLHSAPTPRRLCHPCCHSVYVYRAGHHRLDPVHSGSVGPVCRCCPESPRCTLPLPAHPLPMLHLPASQVPPSPPCSATSRGRS